MLDCRVNSCCPADVECVRCHVRCRSGGWGIAAAMTPHRPLHAPCPDVHDRQVPELLGEERAKMSTFSRVGFRTLLV